MLKQHKIAKKMTFLRFTPIINMKSMQNKQKFINQLLMKQNYL